MEKKEKWPAHVWLFLVLGVLSCYFGYRQVEIGSAALALAQHSTAVGSSGASVPLKDTAMSYGAALVSFIPSLVSLLSLGFAFYSMRRAAFFKRERDMEILKRVTPTFTVTKAEWGNQHKQVRIEDAFGLMPPNALALYLCPDTLRPYTTNQKADIVAGPKFIDITYSSGPNSGSLHRKEGEWIILPEDPIILKERDDALEKYNDEQRDHKETRAKLRESEGLSETLKTEIATTKHYLQGLEQHAEKQATEVKSVRDNLEDIKRRRSIPQLLMRFKEIDRHDAFVFVNEGPDSVQHISIGDLRLKQFNPLDPNEAIQQTVTITPFSGIGVLRKDEDETVRFGAKRDSTQQGLAVFIKELFTVYHFLESDHVISVSYESLDGRKFSREFNLSSDVYGNVIMHANPVQEIF